MVICHVIMLAKSIAMLVMGNIPGGMPDHCDQTSHTEHDDQNERDLLRGNIIGGKVCAKPPT